MTADSLLSDLGLAGPIRFGPGRRAQPLRLGEVRELTVEDLAAAARTDMVQRPVEVKALRQSHHQLARVLAQGVGEAEASTITGYSASRISILKADPAFAELLAYYQNMEAEGYATARAEMRDRLSSLGFDAIETLHEKLLDSPENFDAKTLLAIVEATADRTGYGKTSTVNTNVSHSISEETIRRIKAGADTRSPQVSESDRQALLRLAAEGTAQELPKAEPAQDWIEGEGHLVRETSDPGAGPEVEEPRD